MFGWDGMGWSGAWAATTINNNNVALRAILRAKNNDSRARELLSHLECIMNDDHYTLVLSRNQSHFHRQAWHLSSTPTLSYIWTRRSDCISPQSMRIFQFQSAETSKWSSGPPDNSPLLNAPDEQHSLIYAYLNPTNKRGFNDKHSSASCLHSALIGRNPTVRLPFELPIGRDPNSDRNWDKSSNCFRFLFPFPSFLSRAGSASLLLASSQVGYNESVMQSEGKRQREFGVQKGQTLPLTLMSCNELKITAFRQRWRSAPVSTSTASSGLKSIDNMGVSDDERQR